MEAQLPPTASAARPDPVGSFSAPNWQKTNPSAKSKLFSDSSGQESDQAPADEGGTQRMTYPFGGIKLSDCF